MKLKCDIARRTLHFIRPAGTSRGVYTTRECRFITISRPDAPQQRGVGEASPLPDLSCDYSAEYDRILRAACEEVERTGEVPTEMLRDYPSMLFGIETAMLHLQRGSTALFDTPFARGEEGIPINGLVWMGTFDEMSKRIEEKLAAGFHCIKLKIGAIDFEREIELIRMIREQYGKDSIELRVDANGGFTADEAMDRLEQLARYDIHSIEQPIRQGQWCAMSRLCRETPLPIALDEELIGVNHPDRKQRLLDIIRPQYIILKPSLHGGMAGCREWIAMAAERGIGSWITSALESNIGLNAIAHFAADTYGPAISMPQGLGTGLLFSDNIEMPLKIRGERLWYDT